MKKVKNKAMKRQLWYDIAVMIGSLFISLFIFGRLFTSTRIFSYVGIIGSLTLRIVFAYTLFLVYKLVTDNTKSRIYLRVFLFLYMGLFITLLFSRQNPIYGINMKIGYINDFAPYVFWANMLILAPVGFLIRDLYQLKVLIAIPLVMASVTLLELLQFLFHKGCFDINDIILNSTGFFIGMMIRVFYCKVKVKWQVEWYVGNKDN